jgi:hypothetical protein
MGAAEPKEKREGESGPILDLRLPCWDMGRSDNRRIHEPLDETESRKSSAIGAARLKSLCFASVRRVAGAFVEVIWV